MKAQKCKILGRGSATDEKIHVGQFVRRDSGDTKIRGYISEVNYYSFDVVLFEPDEIPNNRNYIIIHEYMNPEVVAAGVGDMLASNQILLPLWQKISDNDTTQ